MISVLVVGHGLSGAIIAHTLTDHGLEVHCIEGRVPHSASQVATGLINPFIGPKLNTPTEIDECLFANQEFFKKWEEMSNQKLYYKDSLIRVFRTEQQLLKWRLLENEDLSSKFATSLASKHEIKNLGLTAPFGAGITLSYRLDILAYLKLSKERLIAKSRWTSTLFEESMINEFDITIFAEGHNVSANPYFNWLPFAPAQGEILELGGPRLPLCSNGTWFLPHSSKNAKAGSTWKHEDLKSGPTDKGKKTIYKNLNFLPIDQFKLVNHLSGIRSGTMDRSPIIGRHPKISKLYIFNGFGSRGSTTIKMNAERLAEFIILEKPLNQNIDLNRFKKKIRFPT